MIVQWPYLLLALLLLWMPRQLLHLGATFLRRRRRARSTVTAAPTEERERGDPRVGFKTEFAKFRNYVDLLRAVAGSMAFIGGFGIEPCLAVATGASRMTTWFEIGIRSGILLVGLLLQTVRYEKRKVTFYPAIFYIGGLSVGLCDYRGAIFAFVLIWAINPALPSATIFLMAYALFLVVFGHLFSGGGDLSAVFAGALAFLPALLSMLANRPLVIFSRRATRGRAPA